MRNIRFLVCFVTVLLMAVSCHLEKETGTSDVAPEFSSVRVSLAGEGSEGTRSQVMLEAEDFLKASLFAFYHSSGSGHSAGDIAVYPDFAGDLAGSKPVAIEVVGTTSFNWALPVGEDLDIYVIGNYGLDSSELGSFIKSCRTNANLKASDLDNLKFNVQDVQLSSMEYLQVSGIPMGSKTQVRLQSSSSTLTLKVKRLFARYDLWFDLSELNQHSLEVKTLRISSHRVNSSVPFFQEGYKPSSGFVDFDYATNADLAVVKLGGQNNFVTLFVPENCQGNISGASSWDDVVTLGSKVQNCTYLDIYMNIGKRPDSSTNVNDSFESSFPYRAYLYLGSDFTTNFDVVRNKRITHSILIPYTPDPGPSDYFYFNDLNEIVVEPGANLHLDYTTNLSTNKIGFEFVNVSTGANATSYFSKQEQSSMEANFTVSGSVSRGSRFIVTGGLLAQNESEAVTSKKPLRIADASQHVLNDIEVICDAYTSFTEGGSYFSQTVTGYGDDIYVPLKQHDGNDVKLRFRCRVKYDGGGWVDAHDLFSVNSPKVERSLTGYAGRSTVWNSFTDESSWTVPQCAYMPGDVDDVVVYFEGVAVANWKIRYGSDYSNPAGGVYQDIDLTCQATVLNNAYSQSNVFTGNGGNMSVMVDNGGNYVTYQVSGRVKYDNAWHNIESDSKMRLSVGSSTQPWTFTTGRKMVAGDTMYFQVYYGTALVKSWTVTYTQPEEEILFDISCNVSGNGYSASGTGNDIRISASNQGSDMTVSITGQIYYNGSWHNVRTDSNLKCYSDGSLKSSWNWTSYECMPGDEEVVSIKLNGTTIKSWKIYY